MGVKGSRIEYVNEGDLVLAPVRGEQILCEVIVAAGNDARVANRLRKIDRWFCLDDLRFPDGQ